jgi:LEA14-like dessication related protein
MPSSRHVALLVAALLAALLTSCLPGADAVLGPPTFRLQPEGSGLHRLDVTDAAAPSATFRAMLDVANPNPVGVRLALLEGDLYLAGVRAGRFAFTDGLDLPARGQARLVLDVTVGSDALPGLAAALADALAGRALDYRLEAEVGVDVLGVVQRFPRATLLAGSVSSDLRLTPPRLALERDASGVTSVGFDRVVITLALRVHNEGPVGLRVRAPDVRFGLGGRDVATVQLPTMTLPPGSSSLVVQEVVLNPVQLGAAIVTELTRMAGGQAAGVELSLRGGWELEVPGIVSRSVEFGELLRARLE